ncbi:hypothetical protein [Pseudoalteromonas sp. S16_S37]|uniref:hypothetical protein n=1 Tax=Pseudoalteromonas sp. S16_S37 TaxID=2720228 RepID=UPI00168138BF|nr:hypothetical protein [Pseudoalteromonas sp. S16_S37]MBD1583963.1 hypothetical protein [Pseudoalteromonas sp. S16_S37]
MTGRHFAVAITVSLLTQVGCKHSQPVLPVPALFADKNSTNKAKVQQAIVALKGGVAPRIADNVFTMHSTLLLEHGTSESSYGKPILGAHSLPVTRFELQLRGTDCVLYYAKTDSYVALRDVNCIQNNKAHAVKHNTK